MVYSSYMYRARGYFKQLFLNNFCSIWLDTVVPNEKVSFHAGVFSVLFNLMDHILLAVFLYATVNLYDSGLNRV